MEEENDEKLDEAFEAYMETNNITPADEKSGIMVERHDDENGVCDTYTNLENFNQFFNLL